MPILITQCALTEKIQEKWDYTIIKTKNHIYQARPYAGKFLTKLFIQKDNKYSYIGTISNTSKQYIKKILIEYEQIGKPIGLNGKHKD